MELFINQGKDSTVEPGYLAETKQAISEPTLISKTITENDTYNAADDNADGYSSVTVNVPSDEEKTILSQLLNGTLKNFIVSESIGVTQLRTSCFAELISLETVVIPEGVTEIRMAAFSNCSHLESIVLPSSLESIGYSAFKNCSHLVSIEIPSGVTTIASSAFKDCDRLTTITVHKEEDSISGAPWGAPSATVIWDD